uniref:Uncharacterized protein MANES_06G073100 n=1 Tax=Rhizophora mucronata TaxID=61149 RepID=A0A2P2JEN5_RHIMU
MASTTLSSSSSMLLALARPVSHFKTLRHSINSDRKPPAAPLSITASSFSLDESGNSPLESTKLVTFLGKGGSGKTTSAIFAAQHYAMAGLRTCLVIQTQDPSADYLLNCKIGTSPTMLNDNLSVVRLETTKILLEPLDLLKQADAYLKMSQGVLQGVVGEELGVLPAMDSIFAILVIAWHVGFLGNVNQNNKKDRCNIIVYDGISTDETLRMIGAASQARLYLKYLRTLAEKTDLGRLASPSLLRLVDEALDLSGSKGLNGKMSAEIWDILEKKLEQGASTLSEPHNFGCYLVMDLNNLHSINSALRYWGCTIQAGAHVSGAIGISPPHLNEKLVEEVKNKFSPLPFASIPHLSMSSSLDWSLVMQNTVSQDARALISLPTNNRSSQLSSVMFDGAKKSITLFMPGFDKSEIKLYQYRGGSELLVEAGDQRRIIFLPKKLQGKVRGAKFINRSLVVTMQ